VRGFAAEAYTAGPTTFDCEEPMDKTCSTANPAYATTNAPQYEGVEPQPGKMPEKGLQAEVEYACHL
jgi:hypothetical protein